MRKILTILLCSLGAALTPAYADEPALAPLTLQPSLTLGELTPPQSYVELAVDGMQSTLDQALQHLGVRYRRGGSSAASGFDCSGFVRSVFSESLGLVLPHNARAISKAGARVDKTSLQPGDLVFFNTMRRAFSHVGIYLGDNQFVHAPRAGGKVRIENMSDRYWKRRFDGARRIPS